VLANINACFMLVSNLAYSSIMKMKAVCVSETSVNFKGTTWRYVAEGRTHGNLNLIIPSSHGLKVIRVITGENLLIGYFTVYSLLTLAIYTSLIAFGQKSVIFLSL
jgi:hypothetical protein